MNYEQIKRNYQRGLWSEQMVKMAVKKGVLTEEQYRELTGETENDDKDAGRVDSAL